MFRETLEAALIVGIILAYLKKTDCQRYNKSVYSGVLYGIVTSIAAAFMFNNLLGGFSGRTEQIFEGVAMLLGAFFITTVILWMMHQRDFSKHIKQKVSVELKKRDRFGLMFLVFISVLREGVEIVLFLGAASLVGSTNLLGAFLGFVFAILLGYLVFVVSLKVNLKVFFNFSSILLLFFAAGLVAHGVHELQEAKVIPIVIGHVYDINPIFDENSKMGGIAKGLFGYNGNPSLLEIISYFIYLICIVLSYKYLNNLKE